MFYLYIVIYISLVMLSVFYTLLSNLKVTTATLTWRSNPLFNLEKTQTKVMPSRYQEAEVWKWNLSKRKINVKLSGNWYKNKQIWQLKNCTTFIYIDGPILMIMLDIKI